MAGILKARGWDGLRWYDVAQSLMKIGSAVKIDRREGYTDTQKALSAHKHTFIFQNKEISLKMSVSTFVPHSCHDHQWHNLH
jgi:hypothetical protein